METGLGIFPEQKNLAIFNKFYFHTIVQAAQPLLHDIIVPGTSLLYKQEYKMFIDI